jgi:uroporphyrinogen-III synthase
MNQSLAGTRIGVLESRMAGQLTNLFSERGAEVVSAPALRESVIDRRDQVGELIDGITAGDFQFVVFQTGVGVTSLLNEADGIGRGDELRVGLKSVVCVARGPKPKAALRKLGLKVPAMVSAPYTTYELIKAFAEFDMSDCGVAVINYGERNGVLADFLMFAGTDLFEVCLYEWTLPEDTEPLESLIVEVLSADLDAIVFTSQVQVRHLFKIAEDRGFGSVLAATMNSTMVAAIGPTCASSLESYGVTADVVPDYPKMGHMVADLTEYLSLVEARRF